MSFFSVLGGSPQCGHDTFPPLTAGHVGRTCVAHVKPIKISVIVFLARGSLSLCYFYFLLFAPCRLCVYIGGGEIPVLVVLVLSLPLHHDIMFFEFQFGSRSAPSDRATTRVRETTAGAGAEQPF